MYIYTCMYVCVCRCVLSDCMSKIQELKLGELVRAKFDTDFFMLDRYPAGARPFYTMPCPGQNHVYSPVCVCIYIYIYIYTHTNTRIGYRLCI